MFFCFPRIYKITYMRTTKWKALRLYMPSGQEQYRVTGILQVHFVGIRSTKEWW